MTVSDENDLELFKTWVLLDQGLNALEDKQEIVSTLCSEILYSLFVLLQICADKLLINLMIVCHSDKLLESWLVTTEVFLA